MNRALTVVGACALLCSCAFISPSNTIESGQGPEISALPTETAATAPAADNESDSRKDPGAASVEQSAVMSV